MQRRRFSLSAAALAAVSGLSLPAASFAQATEFKNGADFITLDKPVAVDVADGQIEVIEFFWYGCPHCNSFEPQLDAWSKKQSKDVVLKRTPIAFRPDFEPQQRLYYVLEAMGKVDELHKKVFYALHIEKQALNTPETIVQWVEKQGVNKTKFLELYNSFSVSTKARKATQLQNAFQVDGVPALGIAGRYYTSGSMAKSMERALQVADYLVGQTRSKVK